MARPGLTGGQCQPLNTGQIEQIHLATLDVLEHTGLQVENEDALALNRQGGARIEGNRVYMAPTMVHDALQQVPHQVLLAGRDPGQDIVLEGKRVYAGTGGSPTMVLDPGADTVRPSTLRDLADLTRLADALAHCDFIVIPLFPTELSTKDAPINRFYTCLTNTTKHVMGGVGSVAGARQVMEMGTLLMDPHTVQFMRSELYHPNLADRQSRAAWEAKGKQDVRARAIARVKKLLQEHTAPGPPSAADAAIQAKFQLYDSPLE